MFLYALIFTAVIVLYFYYKRRILQCDVNLNPKISSYYVPAPDILTYELFLNRKHLYNFSDGQKKNLRLYLIPFCKLDVSSLGPIKVKYNNNTKLNLKMVESQYPEIRAGGFYAPTTCRPKHRVAIFIPYRAMATNLYIFLHHMHKFMKKQLLEYQIFVIQQIGKDRFNKGSLFNVGYMVSQLFGKWHCYVFHEVDLLPIDDRILYSCPQQPTHMSTAIQAQKSRLPYYRLFGGVTILRSTQYESVNGYSNYYWNWGAEDHDMYKRLQAQKFPVLHYTESLGRYATLPHTATKKKYLSTIMLYSAEKRYKNEGLNSMEFKIINISKEKLFTHILTDINPEKRMTKKQYICS